MVEEPGVLLIRWLIKCVILMFQFLWSLKGGRGGKIGEQSKIYPACACLPQAGQAGSGTAGGSYFQVPGGQQVAVAEPMEVFAIGAGSASVSVLFSTLGFGFDIFTKLAIPQLRVPNEATLDSRMTLCGKAGSTQEQ